MLVLSKNFDHRHFERGALGVGIRAVGEGQEDSSNVFARQKPGPAGAALR